MKSQLESFSFEELLSAGGDERLDLKSNGLNKYFVAPTNFEGVFHRASCTSSPLTQEGLDHARQLYEKLSPEVFDQKRREHTKIIKDLINYEGQDRFDVFYAPSGSDLCYLPILFSKLIHPGREILNLITCPEELGSGSLTAFSGKYYFSRDQFGEDLEKNSQVEGLENIESQMFEARDEDGNIIDHWNGIKDAISENHAVKAVNANLVIGSKSGIENNVSIVSQSPEDVLWTIDLCQFRASRVLINGLIGMNCIAMLTGSKFYQSPPFCAVMLVPKTITSRFKEISEKDIQPFGRIFSRFDIPEEYESIRNHLKPYRNYGLLLRWETAIKEMAALAKQDSDDVNGVIKDWNSAIVERLASSKYFKLMPGQDITNKTIISFRVRSSEGGFLRHDELMTLYQAICGEAHEGMDGFTRALIGQPVKYGDKSFIRFAIGSHDVRSFIKNKPDFKTDFQLIEIIEELVEAKF